MLLQIILYSYLFRHAEEHCYGKEVAIYFKENGLWILRLRSVNTREGSDTIYNGNELIVLKAVICHYLFYGIGRWSLTATQCKLGIKRFMAQEKNPWCVTKGYLDLNVTSLEITSSGTQAYCYFAYTTAALVVCCNVFSN